MKAIRKNLAVLVVVMGVTLFFTGALASADDNQGEPTLAGVWQVEVTLLSACGQAGVVGHLPTLYTFTGDGKVIETPGTPLGLPGTLRTSPGLGTWQHDEGQQFSAVFRAFIIYFGSPDPTKPDNTPAGSITFTEAIELSQDGDSFTSTGTADFFNSNGNLFLHGCHTLAGMRLG